MWSWVPCRLAREGQDRHRWAGQLAIVGVTAGAAMAVFGLPPVDVHGPWHYVGVMDPLCGGTRGLQAMMRGDPAEAWHYNPLTPVLVIGAAVALLREAVGRTRGRWLNLQLVRRRTAIVTGLLLLAALEVNQQAHADLLRTTPGTAPLGGLLYAVVVPLTAAAVVAVVAAAIVRSRSRRRAAGE